MKIKDNSKIQIIKRNLNNNTHEVIQDLKIKNVTSWRKSKKKFLNNLIYNIISFGILHLISLYFPNLYIKLYCYQRPPKECDYFLVENIYGYFTLCLKIHKKDKNIIKFNSDTVKDNMISSLNNFNMSQEYSIIKNLTYSFKYKSTIYEYNEENNEIIPVYLNLSNFKNKEIINYFSEGLSSEHLVNKYKEKFGKNEYYIDINLLFIYFKKNEIPIFIIVLFIGFIELFYLRSYISFILKSIFILIIFILQFLIIEKAIKNKYNKEYTLDGEKKIKVKRRHLLKDYNKFYTEINFIDVLPGDIIYLKENDLVPCDCLIIEGQCIVSESYLTGNLNTHRKRSLENNNEKFNYKYNNINILYHGMKILKINSKSNEGFISVLCINTGANTYKANHYSNILYYLERKSELYKLFGNRNKIIFILILLEFILTFLFGSFFFIKFRFNLEFNNINLFALIYKLIIRILSKSLMTFYFITYSIMIFINLYRLKKEDIICFDKSRLLNSGQINTIIFNKTRTLCQDSLEINSYHPIYFNINKGDITFKNYLRNKCQKMNKLVLKYYQEYLNQINNFNNPNCNSNLLGIKSNQLFNKIGNKSDEYIVLFLECLLTCNNIEKFNLDIFGNNIEKSIFNDMRWDVKFYDYNYNDFESKCLNNNNSYRNINNKYYYYDHQFNLIENKISDIFPKNYYKISESLKYVKKYKKNIINDNSFINDNLFINENENTSNNHSIKDFNCTPFNINPIIDDLSQSNINSYKLRIYKKFIKNSFNSSAIVFNFITKELRFMTKGFPEEILDKCDKDHLPQDIDNIISFYRRRGLILIIYASKLINLEEYNDLNDNDYYMNNLILTGFITLKSKLKNEITKSLDELKQFNCNLIISSGDNEYNCISVGFNTGIIVKNKNIFVFNKDDMNNNITINKAYNAQYQREEKQEKQKKQEITKILPDKTSKHTSKILNNNIPISCVKNIKDKYFTINTLVRSSNTKHLINIKENLMIQKEDYKGNKEWYSPQIKFKPKKKDIYKRKIERKESIKNCLIISPEKKNDFLLSSEISVINTKTKDRKNNMNLISNSFDNKNSSKNELIKYDNNEEQYNNKNSNYKRSIYKNTNCKKYNIYKNKYIIDYEKYYYYSGIFNDYEDLNDNSIYCISGRVFNFLYTNRKIKEYQYLLKKIYKKGKIFFNMSSIDKTLLIDFYKENQNNIICNIGKCESDIDSIIASDVGINLQKPNNQNTILSHFYSSKDDILCIKNIILEGRVFHENIILLELVSFLCTLTLNSFILCCLIRNIDTIENQLNFLEIEYLLLVILSFIGKPKNNINLEPLIQNKKLLNTYYIFELIGILIIKLLTIYIFSSLYHSNYDYEIDKRGRIYVTYYYIMCIEFLICIIYSLNWISFYRKSPFTNLFLLLFLLLLFIYIIILISLNSSNFNYDFFKITYFEFSNVLIDSHADKNRIWLLVSCLFDFIISILYSILIFFIFNGISKILISNRNLKI